MAPIEAGSVHIPVRPELSQFSNLLLGPIRAAASKAAAELNTTLTKSTSGFASRATSALAGVKTSTLAAAAGITAVGVGVFEFLSKGVETFVEVAGEVRKLSRELGITTEDASRLRAEGEALGVGVDVLSRSFGIFSKHLVDGGAAFTKYGISLTNVDGTQKSFNQLLSEASDKYIQLGGGIQGTAFAMDVFGRGGKDLIPILAAGSEKLKEFGDNAEKAGLIMSEKDVQAAKELQIAGRELSESIKGLEITFARGLLPVITDVVKGLTGLITTLQSVVHWMDKVNVAGVRLGAVLLEVAKGPLQLAQASQNAGDGIVDMVTRMHAGESAYERMQVGLFKDAQALGVVQDEMAAFGAGIKLRQGDIRDFVNATGQDWATFVADAGTAATSGNDIIQQEFIDKQITAFKAWRSSLASNFQFVSDRFAVFAGDAKLTAKGIKKALDEQIRVAERYQENINLITNAFGDRADVVVQQISDMGTKGANVAAALGRAIRNGNKDVVDGIISDLNKGGRVAQDTGREFAAAIAKPLNEIKGLLEAIAKHWIINVGFTIEGAAALRAAAGDVQAILNTGHAVFGNVDYHARGTMDAPGGWSWVGEQGPELVNLRPHSTVLPAPISRKVAAAAPSYADGSGWSNMDEAAMERAFTRALVKVGAPKVFLDSYELSRGMARAEIRRSGGG